MDVREFFFDLRECVLLNLGAICWNRISLFA